ncbi:AAA family ATPase [Paracoccus jeotgali]|uniref:AAA family ATPase n=1 Tax=Paracoccus jeotgali TaxID=2065379 RepID=A0A2K9MHH8_9RHOB|nr:AAA family ATPase [Paracoccus jeotgali]AUM73995.1 AAA family ATPase [Paracoccus jeotgali]
MDLFQIMHVKSPALSPDQIADRLSAFLLRLRQQKARAKAAAADLASPQHHGDGFFGQEDGDDPELSWRDGRRIQRRAKSLYDRQLARSGLAHLKREDRDRLKPLEPGVRLARIPHEHRADEWAAALHAEMPWMAPATDFAWRAMRRSARAGDRAFRLPPVILDGPPGIGKTHWAARLGQLTGTESTVVDATGEAASFSVVGCQRGWSNAQPGRLLELVLAKRVGNPVMVIDELDKVGTPTSNRGVAFSLAEALLPLFETATAAVWTCPFYRVRFDMSFVSWVLLTNDVARLPAPLLSRCSVIRLQEVGLEDLLGFAERQGVAAGLSEISIAAILEALTRSGAKGGARPSLRTVQRMLLLAADLEARPQAM